MLYLVRHGEAVRAQENPSRPLSDSGREEVGKTAYLLARHFLIHPGEILHSPKDRAAQTAGILAESLGITGRVLETDGLLPMDDPGIWCDRVTGLEMDTMLVGHLPHLSKLASTLLGWNPEAAVVQFDTATVACLDGGSGGWILKWLISPAALKEINH